jgi:hypothetical protein
MVSKDATVKHPGMITADSMNRSRSLLKGLMERPEPRDDFRAGTRTPTAASTWGDWPPSALGGRYGNETEISRQAYRQFEGKVNAVSAHLMERDKDGESTG